MRKPGAWVAQRWWDQEGIDLAGAREWAAAAVDGEEDIGVEETARQGMTGRH